MNASLWRAVVTCAVTLLLYGSVLLVELIGRQPSSAVLKALAVGVLLAVAVVPLGGGAITLVAAIRDVRRHDRVVQAALAGVIGLLCLAMGMEWLSWLAHPRGDPPGIHVG